MGHAKGIFPPWQEALGSSSSSSMHSSEPWLPPADPLLAAVPLWGQQGWSLAEGSSEFPPAPLWAGFHFKWPFSWSNEGLKLCHMSALVKMEDLLSSCRVQKELLRVKFPVHWTLSAVPGHCLTWDSRHTHQGELEAEISQTQGTGHTNALLLCWLGIRFLPDPSPERQTLSSKFRIRFSGSVNAWHYRSTCNSSTPHHNSHSSWKRSQLCWEPQAAPAEPCWQVLSLLGWPQGCTAPPAPLPFGTQEAASQDIREWLRLVEREAMKERMQG